MPKSADYMNLPFDEAIEFFKQKVNLPTRTWKDLWQGQHTRAFVSAGAMKDELLTELHTAVDKAISQGTTLGEFRKDFDNIVTRHGWQYKGGKGWRSAVIFNTNLSTAYSAGHYAQMTDPDVLKARPYWRYVASTSRNRRPEHMQWYNMVLSADDPWWKTHYPPNGWGCKCGVVSHSAREVERLKKEESGGEFPIKETAPKNKYYRWTDKATGKAYRIPEGINPGWDYNVGEAAWGKKLSEEVMEAWRFQGAKSWERLSSGNWQSAGRPEMIPADPAVNKPGKKLNSTESIASSLKEILGGEEKVFSFYDKKFRHDILVNAESLSQHIPAERTPFLPLIAEALENPYEIWMAFEKHKGTGKVELRQRIIKAVELEKERGLLLVAQARKGMLEAWTMLPTTNFKYLNAQREGKLIYKR